MDYQRTRLRNYYTICGRHRLWLSIRALRTGRAQSQRLRGKHVRKVDHPNKADKQGGTWVQGCRGVSRICRCWKEDRESAEEGVHSSHEYGNFRWVAGRNTKWLHGQVSSGLYPPSRDRYRHLKLLMDETTGHVVIPATIRIRRHRVWDFSLLYQ